MFDLLAFFRWSVCLRLSLTNYYFGFVFLNHHFDDVMADPLERNAGIIVPAFVVQNNVPVEI